MSPHPKLDQTFMKPGEIADLLKVDLSTVYKWIKSGELPSVHVGPTAKRVPRAALEAFIRRSSGDERIKTFDPATGESALKDVTEIGSHQSLEAALREFEEETRQTPEASRPR